MNTRLVYLLFILTSVFCACSGTEEQKGQAEPVNQVEAPSKKNQQLFDDLMKEEAIVIEPQATFDQSQLTNSLLGLCVKFKTLDGADRKVVFDKFETILPSCPVDLQNGNTAEPDTDNAVQVMSFNDLKELLGPPNEIRADGLIVYDLMADKSYKVLFVAGNTGAIMCRFYEGAS